MVQTHPWICFCFLLFGFPECFFVQDTKQPSRKPNIPKKTKEHKKHLRENPNKNKCLKVSDPLLDMGLVLFVFVGFPKVVRKTKQPFGKTKNTKDNQRKHKHTFGETNQNIVFKGFRPTLGYGFVVLFVGFPEGCLQNQTNIRDNHKYTRKPKTTKRTFGKTKQSF